ncbi:MAG: hypothetical protein HYY84_05875 [Deltaproteobacteria bacterium]|nr:hypothetical protein [Deltaproteobacteria bacterium]
MERLNLNIPTEARKTLRRLAKNAKRREGEYARVLLLSAIDQAEREEFYRQVAENMTPAVWKRDLAIARAMERERHRG